MTDVVRPDWHDHALCDGTKDEVFFPASPNTAEDCALTAQARYCRQCPVRTRCLQAALDNRSEGIWAGTTEYLRNQLRRERDRVKCPGCLNQTIAREENTAACVACGLSWTTDRNTE
jgi:hypothetical protein